MTLADITQVVTIDREAFLTPWSAHSYSYEVGESSYSYMVVLEDNAPPVLTGWKRFIRSFNGSTPPRGTVVSYGGLWNIMDEAHISTIASRHDVRGKGYGEVVLAAMIRKSYILGAAYIVLEVRVSNTVAQNLYHKYEFEVYDTKRKYYRDNNEDAYDMRLDLRDSAIRSRFEERYTAIQQRVPFVDQYTNTPRPRP
ncbi:MAG: ribosomal protein S18-alanine N-acetyltransferase [bacterium]|nr:ribosomal protein S18-alanine N-acetyltransferase [bacterium]